MFALPTCHLSNVKNYYFVNFTPTLNISKYFDQAERIPLEGVIVNQMFASLPQGRGQ